MYLFVHEYEQRPIWMIESTVMISKFYTFGDMKHPPISNDFYILLLENYIYKSVYFVNLFQINGSTPSFSLHWYSPCVLGPRRMDAVVTQLALAQGWSRPGWSWQGQVPGLDQAYYCSPDPGLASWGGGATTGPVLASLTKLIRGFTFVVTGWFCHLYYIYARRFV
jgi:hypothetical protein